MYYLIIPLSLSLTEFMRDSKKMFDGTKDGDNKSDIIKEERNEKELTPVNEQTKEREISSPKSN